MSRFANNELLWLLDLASTETIVTELANSIYKFNRGVLRHAVKGLEVLQQQLGDSTSAASTSETSALSTLSDDYFSIQYLISALQQVKRVKRAFDCKPGRVKYETFGFCADNCRIPDISSRNLREPSDQASLRHKQIEQLVTVVDKTVQILDVVTLPRRFEDDRLV